MDAPLSGSSPQESPSILGGQKLGFCGVCPPGPLIKPSDFSGHLVSVFLHSVVRLEPLGCAFNLM